MSRNVVKRLCLCLQINLLAMFCLSEECTLSTSQSKNVASASLEGRYLVFILALSNVIQLGILLLSLSVTET